MTYEKLRNKAFEIQKEKQFNYNLTSPTLWKYKAQLLKHAADKLYDIAYKARMSEIKDILKELKEHGGQLPQGSRYLTEKEIENSYDASLMTTYFFLIGHAIENLLKAKSISMGKRLKEIKTHDLVKLCQQCKIKIQKKDEDWLEKLTIYVIWLGTYPIPLQKEDMLPIKKKDGEWIDNIGEPFLQYRQGQKEINALIEFIEKQ